MRLLTLLLLLASAPAVAQISIVNTVPLTGTSAHSDNSSATPDNGVTTLANDAQIVFTSLRLNTGLNTIGVGGHTMLANRTNSVTTGTTNPTAVFGKATAAGEADPTASITLGGAAGATLSAAAVVLRGVDTADFIDGFTVGSVATTTDIGADQTHPTPALTVTNANTLVLLFCKFNRPSTDVTLADGTFTKLFHYSSTVGDDQTLAAFYKLQTTPSNISASTITFVGESTAVAAICIITNINPASASAPAFDGTAPSVTARSASTHTITYNADANATHLYCGSYPKGGSAPSAAALKAGTGAHGVVDEATTGSSDTVVLTPTDSPAFPIYDDYCVLEGPGGFSSVLPLVDEALDAPAGYDFTTVASIHALGWVKAHNDAAGTTAIAVGDILVTAEATTPAGHLWHQFNDGRGCYPWNAGLGICTGGDSSRQELTRRVYGVSAGAYMTGIDSLVFNNQPITCEAAEGFPLIVPYKTGTARDLLNLAAICQHGGGDVLAATLQSGALPSNSSLSGAGVVSTAGADVEDEAGIAATIRLTDTVGGTFDASAIFYPLDTVTVPSCISSPTDATTCAATLVDLFLAAATTYECRGVTTNQVIAQSPAAASEAEPFSTVSLVASIDKSCVLRKRQRQERH